MLCPLYKEDCKEEKCGWWQGNECSIATLGATTKLVENFLDVIAKVYKEK